MELKPMKIQVTKTYEVPEGNYCVRKGKRAYACKYLMDFVLGVVVYKGRCSVFDEKLTYNTSVGIKKCPQCKKACERTRKQ